ncbi:MAG: hypothetical protein AB7N91_18960 [Candidatus Tectimicrobiota bacterium]
MSLRRTLRGMFRLCCGLCLLLGAHALAWLLPVPGYAEDLAAEVTLSTDPPPEHIRPDGEAVRVTLSARLQGKPLSGGHLQLQVTAPPRSTILTTDFPHVEGSALLALASDLQPDGTWSMQYVFPIRGDYTFALQLVPLPGGPAFRPTSLTHTLHVAENPEEVRNIWFVVGGLFLLGVLVGHILARSAAAREALQPGNLVVFCLLTAGLLALGSPHARAQEHAHSAPVNSGTQVAQGGDGWELTVQPQPASATVGQLLDLGIVLKKDGQIWPRPLEVLLQASSQEDGKDILRTTLWTQSGQMTPRLQFFDGAPHSVTVTARPLAGSAGEVAPLTVTMGLEVLALHPPMAVKLRILALLLIVLVGGMVAGFFLPTRLKESGRA